MNYNKNIRRFIGTHLAAIGWILGGLSVILPAIAWLQRNNWQINLDAYSIFPPLGIVAFGLMWTHFVMGALKRYSGSGSTSHSYMVVSMGIVLALIILHPGLLWLALYTDGLGLPPFSHYAAYQMQKIAVTLGTIGLSIFLAFELKKFFAEKVWWHYVEKAQILGMAVIFVHALQLGNQVTNGWFLYVWVFYGLTLAASVVYSEYIKRLKKGEIRE